MLHILRHHDQWLISWGLRTLAKPAPIKLKSIWISDIHLGFKGCQAQPLLNFLHSTETEYLFLVGDIVDFWSLQKSAYWPQAHTNVVRSILGKAQHGTKVIYIPGNHDEVMREYCRPSTLFRKSNFDEYKQIIYRNRNENERM